MSYLLPLAPVFGLLAILALGGLLCRINDLGWATHSKAVVGMHAGLAIACCWAMGDFYYGQITPGALGAVGASLCWLYISLPTWREGPPTHVKRPTSPAPSPTER